MPLHQPDSFCDRVARRCGDDFRRCVQCVNCAAQCPFGDLMTCGPNGLIRLVQYGFAAEVLGNPDIWACINCRTCSITCPMAIDIPALAAALREMAMESGARLDQTAILKFRVRSARTRRPR